MEKTIVKVEKQQLHNGSKSATTELIAVDDPDALRCPKCLNLLKPPVFQCAAGHLVCSSCHDELPDKNKCASCFIKTAFTRCFIPTVYNRCPGVEHILQSIRRVACPNATGGKMLNHEKEEHEKIRLPSKADHAHAQSQGRIVEMGPCGGGGGNGDGWKMNMSGINRIVKVVIWHGGAVDAIRVLYEHDGARKEWTKWGGSGGKRCEIHLQPDEYLTCVKGHIGHYNGWFVVRSLSFVSNRRTFGRCGEAKGSSFELPAAGGKIVGFHGRAGCLIDALGTYVELDV